MSEKELKEMMVSEETDHDDVNFYEILRNKLGGK